MSNLAPNAQDLLFMEIIMLKKITTLAALCCFSLGAAAEKVGQLYVGLTGGNYELDFDEDLIEFDGKSTFGFQAGYFFTRDFSVEVEYLNGEIERTEFIRFANNPEGGFSNIGSPPFLLVGGSLAAPFGSISIDTTESFSFPIRTEDVDLDALAVYGVYRSQGTFYFLGKLGVVSFKVDGEDTEGEIAATVGAGIRFNSTFSIEGGYSRFDDELDHIGFSARVTF